MTVLAYEPDLQKKWREDVGIPLRSPRVGYEEVVRAVMAAGIPTVFMREGTKTTDIVIRFPWSSLELSDAHRAAYFDNVVRLESVFSDVLSTVAVKGESTIKMKLANEAYHAYKLTWLRLFRTLYRDQFDPRINPPKWLSDVEKTFFSKRQAGRLRKDDDKQLRSRFNLLVDHCEKLHRQIAEHPAKKSIGTERDRVQILRTYWKEILRIPGGVSILGGEAFLEIPYGKQLKPSRLEDPTSWKARQLAIALLAFDLKQDYHTIERKFPVQKKPKRSSSCK